MENTIGITPNTFHDFQKKFKTDTFEIYKRFVPVEVQSPSPNIVTYAVAKYSIETRNFFCTTSIQ